MHLLHIDEKESLHLIATVTANLPTGCSLGRILAVSPVGILAHDNVGQVSTYGLTDDGATWRIQALDGSIQERTTWRKGFELFRGVVPETE